MKIAILNHLEEKNKGLYSGIIEGAKRENLKDLIVRLKRSAIFDRIILQTNSLETIRDKDIEIENTADIKDFGQRFAPVIERFRGYKIFYSGSGSSIFLRAPSIRRCMDIIKVNQVIANNLYSADYFFLRTDKKRLKLEGCRTDNSFPRLLVEKYGFYGIEIDRNEYTLFDIDAPLDLLVLKLKRLGGANLKNFLNTLELSHINIKRALDLFISRDKEVLFWGRISEFLIKFLRYRTACRTKFLVEGRGLVAQGQRRFYSLFFDTLLKSRKDFLIENLARYCDGLFIDSRILFAHLGLNVNREDRFALDMLDYKRIRDRHLRELCRMALESKIPIIFCNHSFLNSGIPLLVDYIWREKGYSLSKYGNGIVKRIIEL